MASGVSIVARTASRKRRPGRRIARTTGAPIYYQLPTEVRVDVNWGDMTQAYEVFTATKGTARYLDNNIWVVEARRPEAKAKRNATRWQTSVLPDRDIYDGRKWNRPHMSTERRVRCRNMQRKKCERKRVRRN